MASDAPDPAEARPAAPTAVVKKYANRRLYNTATSSYVTLDELSQMIRRAEDFVVFDAKSGEDITRSVLTQIILEEDSKGKNLLPISFLRQLIGFYDGQMQSFLPRYLEVTMETFTKNQEQMRGYVEETFGRFFPVGNLEELARQNMAIFQRAATMFRPFPGGPPTDPPPETPDASEPPPRLDQEMRELRQQMEILQRQLATMNRNDRPG